MVPPLCLTESDVDFLGEALDRSFSRALAG
jgi:hypothetical protein